MKILSDKTTTTDIIKTAISAEIKRLEINLNRTNKEIEKFETKYSTSTKNFLEKGSAEDLTGRDNEYIQWSGEIKIRERLTECLQELQNIEYVVN